MKHRYTKLFFMLVLLSCGWTIQAQEICDNGMDDDSDGLIDLNDPECVCHEIVAFLSPDILSNGSFEKMDCCPTNFSQFECVQDWQLGNWATSDYLHSCGFILSGVQAGGLVPFPDGEGIAGIIISKGWSEYLSICLNDTLPCGSEVTVTFWTAFTPIQNNGQYCSNTPNFGPVPFTIYGAPHCNNLTVDATTCPTDSVMSWKEMGSTIVQPLNEWHKVSITFTASEDITAIMLGGPCQLPGVFSGAICYAYFTLDGVVINEKIIKNKIPIEEIGSYCAVADTLIATAACNDTGHWQWYFEGVALNGETTPQLALANFNHAVGTYQVVNTTGGACSTGSILVDIRNLDTAVLRIENTLVAQELDATYQWVDCAKDYLPIPGATGAAFKPTVNGTYAVIVINGTCIDTSACFDIMTVGVEKKWIKEMRVYPNPTSGSFTLEFGQIIDRAHLEIIDVYGRITQAQEVREQDQLALTLSGAPGLYWVRLYSDGEMLAVVRVLKE